MTFAHKPVVLLAVLTACGGESDVASDVAMNVASVDEAPTSRAAAAESVVANFEYADPVANATTSNAAEESRTATPDVVVRHAEPTEPVVEKAFVLNAATARSSVLEAMPAFDVEKVESAWSKNSMVYYVHGKHGGRPRLFVVLPSGEIEERESPDGDPTTDTVDDDDS